MKVFRCSDRSEPQRLRLSEHVQRREEGGEEGAVKEAVQRGGVTEQHAGTGGGGGR